MAGLVGWQHVWLCWRGLLLLDCRWRRVIVDVCSSPCCSATVSILLAVACGGRVRVRGDRRSTTTTIILVLTLALTHLITNNFPSVPCYLRRPEAAAAVVRVLLLLLLLRSPCRSCRRCTCSRTAAAEEPRPPPPPQPPALPGWTRSRCHPRRRRTLWDSDWARWSWSEGERAAKRARWFGAACLVRYRYCGWRACVWKCGWWCWTGLGLWWWYRHMTLTRWWGT